VIAAEAHLPGDAEDVGGKQRLGLPVAGRGRAVEAGDGIRPVLDALAQHVHHAAPGDFALQPRQELLPGGMIIRQMQPRRDLRLGGFEEGAQFGKVYGVVAVVVVGIALDVARVTVGAALIAGHRQGFIDRLARECRHDQAFETFFAGVGWWHYVTSLLSGSRVFDKSLSAFFVALSDISEGMAVFSDK